MTTTTDPESVAIEARRASAQVRAAAGRLRSSLEIIEDRAAVLTSAERRKLLARACAVILDAFTVRAAAEKTIPASAPAIYMTLIRQETTSIMNDAAMRIRQIAGTAAYAELFDRPLDLAEAIVGDLAMMGASKPRAKSGPTAAERQRAAKQAFDRARGAVVIRSDEENASANDQAQRCPECGQPMPADEPAAGDDGQPHAGEDREPVSGSSARHRHWTTHNIAVIARKSADGKPMVRIAASSNAVDLEEDQFQLSALREMRDQFPNKLIFHNHKYAVPSDIFGVVEKAALRERGGLTFLDLDVKVATDNPVAVTTYNMIASGVRLGVSVGILVREAERRKDEKGNVVGGFNILHVLALETSIVGIPANQTAWTQGTKRLRGAALREAREMMALR